jgi:hypothetical protein
VAVTGRSWKWRCGCGSSHRSMVGMLLAAVAAFDTHMGTEVDDRVAPHSSDDAR